MIDFESHLPYYEQLRNILRGRIETGDWATGDRLPSEAELCDTFRVSRTVVRQALQELSYEGLIKRRKGKGSFVVRPKISEQLVQKLTGFYQDMVEQGHTPVTKVLALRTVPASTAIAGHLNIGLGAQVTEIERLRSVDGVPIVLVTTYIPDALCPGLIHEDLNNQSLYEMLEARYQLVVARGRRTIQAVLADGGQAKLLGIAKGAPLLRLDSTSFLSDGRGLEYYVAYHRGDRSQFEVELIRTREPNPLEETDDLPSSNGLLAG